MRVRDSLSFSKWILDVGNGNVPTIALNGEEEQSWIKIPNDFLIAPSSNPISTIVSIKYPNLVQQYKDPEYLRSRGILTPINQMVDDINSYILDILPGEQTTYLSSDSICKTSENMNDQDIMFPTKFLNTL